MIDSVLLDHQIRRWRNLALLALLPLSAVFLLFPEIDLWFSRLFLDATAQFPADTGLWHFWRIMVWDMSVFLALFSLAMFVLGLLRGGRTRICRRIWLFVFLGFLLGPGVLANGILKSFWGRARPQAVTEFGGTHQFSPPVLIADQCQSNCSFVSGEASGAFTLALILGLLFLPGLKPRARILGATGLAALAVWTSLLRVMTGRHFLSDALFAADLMVILVFSLFLWLGLARCVSEVTPRQIVRDLQAGLRAGGTKPTNHRDR